MYIAFKQLPMYPGSTYHVYNHANGRENLFAEHKNYDFFLGRLALHVLPVAHIYCYCLMPNHFHLLLKIRTSKELAKHFMDLKERQIAKKAGNMPMQVQHPAISEEELIKRISKPFSNLFNSYTQSFNKMYSRKGSLFMQNMKREEVTGEDSFCKVVHYIHANPVHHRFVKSMDQWPHSSYKIFLSKNVTQLERDHVLGVFDGLDKFIKYHEQPIDPKIKCF